MRPKKHQVLLIPLYAATVIVPALSIVIAAQTVPKGENVPETQSLKSEVERLKNSIKRWNNANMLFIGIAAICAAGLVVTGLALNRKNDDLASIQDSLSEIEKQETARAQKETAEAQLALRQYVDDVNRDRGPRMIVDHEAFLTALRGKPKAKAEIWFTPNNDEAFELAGMIKRWLGPGVDGDGAGWEVGEPKPIPPDGGDPKVSPYAPPEIKYGAIGGMAIASNRLWTPLDKNTAYEALMDAFFTARLVPSGERIPALPDNLFIIIIGQKR
jgi:hypothetical protein